MLRDPGDLGSPERRVDLGQGLAAHSHSTSIGLDEPQQDVGHRRLPGARRTDERDRSAVRDLQRASGERGPRTARRTATTTSSNRTSSRAGSGRGGPAAGPWIRDGLVEDGVDRVRRPRPPSAPTWYSADRRRSGRKNSGARSSTASARSNASPPAISRTLVSIATSAVAAVAPHSSTSVVWNAVRRTSIVRRTLPPADLLDRLRLLGAPPEHLQRRQPPQDVEEVGVHPRQLAFATFGQVADASADQPEQQHEHGPAISRISTVHGSSTKTTVATRIGTMTARTPRRHVSRDVRVERLDALPGGVDELADPLPADCRWGRARRARPPAVRGGRS